MKEELKKYIELNFEKEKEPIHEVNPILDTKIKRSL